MSSCLRAKRSYHALALLLDVRKALLAAGLSCPQSSSNKNDCQSPCTPSYLRTPPGELLSLEVVFDQDDLQSGQGQCKKPVGTKQECLEGWHWPGVLKGFICPLGRGANMKGKRKRCTDSSGSPLQC